MHRYAHYTPMTDTVELAACHRGAPMHEVPTAQFLWIDHAHPVTPAPAAHRPGFGRTERALTAAAAISIPIIGAFTGLLPSLGVL